MKKFSFKAHFNWKILLIRILVNAAAIGLTTLLLPNIYFADLTLVNLLIIAVTLGVLNAVIKPALMFLTAQLFFATFGFLVILINALILYIISWLFPEVYVVDGLLWALIGGLMLGLISNALENLLGVYPPIVPDEDQELRQRIMRESATPLERVVRQPQPTLSQVVETQSLSDFQAASAVLELVNGNTPEGPPASGSGPAKPAPAENQASPEGGEA